MVLNRVVVTDPADLAWRIAWAIMRRGRFAIPNAERKGAVKISFGDCQHMAQLIVEQLKANGLIEAVFEVYDGRSVQTGRSGLKAEE